MRPARSTGNRYNLRTLRTYMVISLVMAASAIGVSSLVKLRSRAQSKTSAQIADPLLYRQLFHHVLALKKKASEAEQKGEDATQFRTHFQRQAKLSDAESVILEQTALEYEETEKTLDAQAKTIIAAYKAQFINGQAPNGQELLPPPAQLKTLSQERDALTLRQRDRVRRAFGNDFERFDAFVKTRIQSNINQQSR